MNYSKLKILRIIGRKLAVILVVAGSAATAFATLGDGKKKSDMPKASLLTSKVSKPGSFSLRSGYSYRGNSVLNTKESEKKYINLNTTVTYQRGNTTYIVPLKKKVILNNVKIEIGNRQFQRN